MSARVVWYSLGSSRRGRGLRASSAIEAAPFTFTYWTARTFRMVARTLVVLTILTVAGRQARAQLRPLDPVDFQSFHGAPVHVQAGGGVFWNQHASLAGTRGTLWEVGEFRATIRTGRMVMELGGTVQRLFRDDEILYPPFGDAT